MGILDELLGKVRLNRGGQRQHLVHDPQVLVENLDRVVLTTIWTEGEDTVDRVPERAMDADNFGLKVLFSVVVDGHRSTRNPHRGADAKCAFWLVAELHLLETTVKGFSHVPQDNRLGVLDLLFRPELVVSGGVPTIGAVTWEVVTLEAGAKLDLEIPLAARLWAFAPGEAPFIGRNRNGDRVTHARDPFHQTASSVATRQRSASAAEYPAGFRAATSRTSRDPVVRRGQQEDP